MLSPLRCPLQGSAQALPPKGFCSLPKDLFTPLWVTWFVPALWRPGASEDKDCAFFIPNPAICTWEGFTQHRSNSCWGSWLPLGLSLDAGGGDGRLDFDGGDSGILQREMFIFLQVTQRKFRCLIVLLSHVKASSELNREILSRPTKEGGRYS